MDTEIRSHCHPHLLGKSATHPIEPRYGTLAALLRLALHEPAALSPPASARESVCAVSAWPCMSPQRCPPCRAPLSRSLSPFALSTGTQVPVEPQRSPLPGTPITAHSGAFNCGF